MHSDMTSPKGANLGERTRASAHMFTIAVREDSQSRIVIIGKPSRKKAGAFLNVPVSPELHDRLAEHVVGSLAMGTAALLEWALDELDSRGFSVEARANV